MTEAAALVARAAYPTLGARQQHRRPICHLSYFAGDNRTRVRFADGIDAEQAVQDIIGAVAERAQERRAQEREPDREEEDPEHWQHCGFMLGIARSEGQRVFAFIRLREGPDPASPDAPYAQLLVPWAATS